MLPEVPPLITDILISLDDRCLYFSPWLRCGGEGPGALGGGRARERERGRMRKEACGADQQAPHPLAS